MYCPKCMTDVACADDYPCLYCGTILHALPSPLNHDIRVFVDSDGDGYYAARTKNEAMSYISKLELGYETTVGVEEMDLYELEENMLYDETELSMTFRQALDQMVKSGCEFPCVFAWNVSRI